MMGHNLTRREGRECHPVVYAVLDTHVRSVGNCTAEQHQIGSISEILQNSCAPIAGRNAMIFGQRDDIGGRNPQGLGAAFKDGSTRYGECTRTPGAVKEPASDAPPMMINSPCARPRLA
jgi:hypothetical protein